MSKEKTSFNRKEFEAGTNALDKEGFMCSVYETRPGPVIWYLRGDGSKCCWSVHENYANQNWTMLTAREE